MKSGKQQMNKIRSSTKNQKTNMNPRVEEFMTESKKPIEIFNSRLNQKKIISKLEYSSFEIKQSKKAKT